MNRISKFVSAALSAALSAVLAASSVSAAGSPMSVFEETQCAPGQTIAVPIKVDTGDNFESAQFKLIFGELKEQDSEIIIEKVVTEASDLSVSTNKFQGKSYVNIICYSTNGNPVRDGTIVTVYVTIPEDTALTECDVTLRASVFATFGNATQQPDDVVQKISINKKLGDANGDDVLNVRDAAYLSMLISRKADPLFGDTELPAWADFNNDQKVNVRDCAAIAQFISTNSVKK